MNEENEEKKDAVICSHCGRVIYVYGGETYVETHDGDIICEDCADTYYAQKDGKWYEWCDSQYGIKAAAM